AHRDGFPLQGQGLVSLERADRLQRLRPGLQHRRPFRPQPPALERRGARAAVQTALQRRSESVVDVRSGPLRLRLGRQAASNARGAELLGLNGAKPGADDGLAAFVKDALKQNVEALWVFGHDLTARLDANTLEELKQKVRLIVFSGTNENPTAALAHWALPTA